MGSTDLIQTYVMLSNLLQTMDTVMTQKTSDFIYI